jgi:molybdate transport system substrate-binding protein
MKRRGLLGVAGAAALGFAVAATPGRAEAIGIVTVFAAASLAEVLTAFAAHRPASAVPLRFSFAASSTLARQIEQGAPVDLYISADEEWMNYLIAKARIVADTRRVVARNRLVVVERGVPSAAEPGESTAVVRAALLPQAGAGRIATGDPAHVPAGRYAQAALTRLGLWAEVEPRLVRADNVRSALAFVERGEASAGIVYATDMLLSRQVRTVARFPEASHPPIVYPAAVVAGAVAGAREVLAELFTPQAQSVFAAAGFGKP